MNQQAEKIITKEDIGSPQDFRHVFHVGPGDRISAETDVAFRVEPPPDQEFVTTQRDEDEKETRDDDEFDEAVAEKPINKSDIGYPTDFRHVIHVSCTETRGFNVETEDEKLSEFMEKANVSEDEDPSEFILDYIEKQLKQEDKSKYEFLNSFKGYLLETRANSVEPVENSETLTVQRDHDGRASIEPGECSAVVNEDLPEKIITKDDIGFPTDFRHVTHISCNESDEFIIETNDETMSEFFKKAGVSDTDLHNKDTLEFILDYIENHLEKQKEETSKNELLKNLKEYLLQFKARSATIANRAKMKSRNRRSKYEVKRASSKATEDREKDTVAHDQGQYFEFGREDIKKTDETGNVRENQSDNQTRSVTNNDDI